MRFIDKRVVCKPLQRRRHNKPQTDIEAKKAWRRFNKQAIRKSCYKQQYGLCAYTELSLDGQTLGCHLEHIAPRSRFPDRTFEAGNIILAALDDCYSGRLEKSEQFGGHYKQALYEDSWFIGPFDPRCEHFFQYCDKTGTVYANRVINSADQTNTSRTIAALNLNCDYLVSLRVAHLQSLSDAIQSRIQQGCSDSLEQQVALSSLREAVLSTKENKLPMFYSAKKQLLQRAQSKIHLKAAPSLTT